MRRGSAAVQAALVDHLTDQLDRVTSERDRAEKVARRLLEETHALRAQLAEREAAMPELAGAAA